MALSLIPDTDRQVHSGSDDHFNSGPLSLGPILSARLKNLREIDKWSSTRPCLSVRGLPVTTEPGLYLFNQDGLSSTLCSIVKEPWLCV